MRLNRASFTRSFAFISTFTALSIGALTVGCGPVSRTRGSGDTGDASTTLNSTDLAGADFSGSGGCAEVGACYTVYAHADHVLYKVDLANKMLVTVGPFKAPMVTVSGTTSEDVITDLAVAPDNTIYAISHASLYTADPNDGHVTLVGAVTTCGSDNVALTFTADGSLYAADYKGAFCQIDITAKPPAVKQITAMIGMGYAVSGDLVAVADGTMYATAYQLGKTGNDSLVKIDPSTGLVTKIIGTTGYPKLYGTAFQNSQVFGFTHDGSGDVVTIDPNTGKGTLYNTFMDPSTNMGIPFAGAAVNAMVMDAPPG